MLGPWFARVATPLFVLAGSPWLSAPARAQQVDPSALDAGALPTPPDAAIEVTVRASPADKAQRTRESSQAVNVVELGTVRQQSADMGEVLARAQGINVRRQNGLGSTARFALNGLQDDQIRVTLDEIPLELAGMSQGLGNIPLLSLKRVEIYRGVVPIRFGADALGGLINLVSQLPTQGLGGSASYQIGSFGTQRAAAALHYLDGKSGLTSRAEVFGDYARNDYPIDAPVGDDYRIERVKRFHDRYRALGGALEIGVVKRPWAQRLTLRAFAMTFGKQLQHSPFDITRPYGAARYGRENFGANLRYEQPLARGLRFQAVLGYAFQPTRFNDDSRWVYDWRGERVNRDPNPGETGTRAIDQVVDDHQTFARLGLAYRPADGHRLELVVSQLHTLRRGRDRAIESGRDPLRDRRQLLSLVSGLSYELNLFDDLLENTVFVKGYVYRTRADDVAPNGVARNTDASVNRLGGGDALRVRITRFLYGKLSYELATRLPSPLEVFGDGVLIQANLALEEETSHNGNLELTLDADAERAGRFRASLNGFIRRVDNQIVRIGFQRADTRYENVYRATSRGVEANAGWTSPHDYFELDANLTYFDLRNDSSKGTFGMHKGDRIPNRPYLFLNATARTALRGLFAANDELSLTWYLRYVHDFFRYWEGAGLTRTKDVVPAQWSQALVLAYEIELRALVLNGTIEAHNITDAQLFDEFGIPRPGRAYYSKFTLRY